MKESCANCIYYELFTQYADDDFGLCRRNAPIWRDMSQTFYNSRDNANFPVITSDKWCGEYKSKGDL